MDANFQRNLDMVINTIKMQRDPNKYLEEQLNLAINDNPLLKDIVSLLFGKNSNNNTLDKMMSSICKEYGIDAKDSINYIQRNIK